MPISNLLLPLTSLPRIGPAITTSLTNLIGQNKIFDLLLHKPIRAEKILIRPRLFEVAEGQLVIIKAKVESHAKPATPRQPYKIICYTPTGYVNLIFFKIFPSQLAKMKIGSEIAILGHLEKLSGENQIVHPQEVLPANEIEKLPQLNVIYPLTAAITQKFLTKKIHEVLTKYDEKNEEWIDLELLKQQGWSGFGEALKSLHYFKIAPPSLTQSVEDLMSLNSEDKLLRSSAATQPRMTVTATQPRMTVTATQPRMTVTATQPRMTVTAMQPITTIEEVEKNWQLARQRLAYDELLAWQIAVLLAKNKSKQNKKFLQPEKNLAKEFLTTLPFQPTKAQLKAISEIESEIFSNKKMLRLLQGDVGSGKTVVAISACLSTISQQKQTCVIAPTTVLAKQHLYYFRGLLANFKIRVELLTSATTKKQKSKIISDLAAGEIDVLISTHAVLEDDVKFKNLGLAVIDEQHRFGVMQRLKLVEKSVDVDTLLMSATPIPRSLMMGLYGEMDISILNEKPKNRQRIETLVMSAKKTNDIHEAMKRAVLRGEKIYWICPAIETKGANVANISNATDEEELVSVKKKYAELTKIFGAEKVGLLHGKMKESEKEKVMTEFANCSGRPACPPAESDGTTHGKSLAILVATTVIEVGIDVPDATVILVENAENFGLSQLHQLRGRVGRSDKKSFCILLYGENAPKRTFSASQPQISNWWKRLNILRQSDDGFFIAEEDLKMRGSGELLGTKQSGFPEFKIADLNLDSDLLKIAHKNAQLILHLNSLGGLKKNHHELLRLFSYDDCLKMISGG
jgi:ATP-dependent DNA helicase RecG